MGTQKRPHYAFPICLWVSISLVEKLEYLHFTITAILHLREGEIFSAR